MVAVVGRPNVGKSTLVNALVGTKVSIVSNQPQTTRFAVRGVLHGDGYQVVFTDTPGYHKPSSPLGQRLNARVDDSVSGVDVVLLVVDASGGGVGRGDAFVAEREVRGFGGTKVCAVNKVDRLQRRDVLVEALPEGPALYPADASTDLALETRLAEVVREKALALTREEVPHSIAVDVESFERDDVTGFVTLSCSVLVERDSQKGIVIGKGGRMLREIGTRARLELERMLGARVFLDLRVRVLKDWQRDPRALDRLGL